jgi:hypothetical protein
MAQNGMTIGLFDWELAGEDHRDRLERLFGSGMPKILYCRCERPLVSEAERLKRIVRDEHIEYALYDSVAFACDGPPEAAEIAGKYFRAVRTIGCGSLHIAHVTKSENNDQRPFGSAFWHNGARSTWYVQAAEPSQGRLHLGLFHRKSNLGPLKPAVSYTLHFSRDRTEFCLAHVAENPELAERLTVQQRMLHLLQRGPMAPKDIAHCLDAKVETVDKTVRRYPERFVQLSDGRVDLMKKPN